MAGTRCEDEDKGDKDEDETVRRDVSRDKFPRGIMESRFAPINRLAG